jgi:hypothetical protein
VVTVHVFKYWPLLKACHVVVTVHVFKYWPLLKACHVVVTVHVFKYWPPAPLLTDCPLKVASERNLHCLVSVMWGPHPAGSIVCRVVWCSDLDTPESGLEMP